MININKVYTCGGDKGDTSLVGGGRVPKNHARVEAYGTVDELNATLGLVRIKNLEKEKSIHCDRLEMVLRTTQNRLFDLGSDLATSPEAKRAFFISQTHVKWLEQVIDVMNEELKPLNSFVLPGGGAVVGYLHLARAVCRRAERRTLTLSREEPVGEWSLPYLNRLSDALFVMSRWVGSTGGEREFLWEPGQPDPEIWSTEG